MAHSGRCAGSPEWRGTICHNGRRNARSRQVGYADSTSPLHIFVERRSPASLERPSAPTGACDAGDTWPGYVYAFLVGGRAPNLHRKSCAKYSFRAAPVYADNTTISIWTPVHQKTCLWLKNLPELRPTAIVKPTATWCPSGSYSKKHGKMHKGIFTKDRAKNRAKTFLGIAKAMAEQWAGKMEARDNADADD